MSRFHFIALGGGILSALFYLSVKLGSPGAIILAYLAQLPLFLVGLSMGVVPAAVASGVAAVAVGAGENLNAAGLYLLLVVGPVLTLVRQALLSRPGAIAGQTVWYPPGHLAGCLSAYGLVMLVGATLLLAADGGIESTARDYLDKTLKVLAAPADQQRFDAMIAALVRLFPAAVIITWTFMVAINANLAQNVLTQFGRNTRPRPEFASMILPQWLTTGLALAVLASLLPGQFGLVAQNAAIILAVPFFFLGLATVHTISRRVAVRRLFLVLFYFLLLVFGWPAVLLAGLGFMEQWLGLRQRFAPPAADKEDE